MGKLAERLSDPARAGVYRIETTEALEEAAALNGYRLLRIALEGGASGVLDAAGSGAQRVIVVSGFEPFLRERPAEVASLLARLGAAAAAWRETGARIFVAFLDPAGALPALAPLYNWTKQRT